MKNFVRKIPLFLTLSRLLATFILLIGYAISNRDLLIYTALWGFFSELIDGPIARMLKVTSLKGRALDANTDLLFFSTFLLGIVYLFWDQYQNKLLWIISVLLALGITTILGFIKLKKFFLTNHLFLQRLTVYVIFGYGMINLLSESSWVLFYFLIALLHLSNIEQIIFILLLQNKQQEQFHSVMELINDRRKAMAATAQ